MTSRAAVVAAIFSCAISACSADGSSSAGTGSKAGTPDGSAGDGSTGVAPVLGASIDAPASEEWVWVPIEGTQCADGTEAGVGVNFTS